jgi:UDP-N-acetylmuramate: L-alanyl-gamma-D-glutamyl-meso-diaminopimelate ligase
MDKIIKHIHILGIAGTMTAPLANALIKKGYLVTGSDQQNIYPPISQLISKIPLNQPLSDIDLAIIGSSFKSFLICKNEFEQIKKLDIPYISATNYLAQNLIKNNSILVAGSFGKTTITSILSWIMPNSNYFFGGVAINDMPSLNFSDSDWSIIEADESINGLDTQAKFLYYPVKYLILTSVKWEHKESYQTAEDNFSAYKNLIEKLPTDGLLVYNPNDPEIDKLLPSCRSKKVPYGNFDFKTSLIGQHNKDNINAALTLCHELGINSSNISTYKGLRRRLEIVSDNNNILVIDDFAQSAIRVKSAIEAIRFSYPNRPIKIYFEPHASFLHNQESLREFDQMKSLCQEFILGKIIFSSDKQNRITAKDWQDIFAEKFHYFPNDTDIISYLTTHLRPNDILVHFSSGGLDGLNNLKKVYNST